MMISTSCILSTGEKKWMPMKFSGRSLASARPVIGKVEVFEPNTALSRQICASAFFVTSALISRLSNTASMMRSQPFRVGVVGRRLDQRQQLRFFSSVERPFAICPSSSFVE